jgi:hypothetical protein
VIAVWTPKVGEKFHAFEKYGQFEGHAHRGNPFVCTGLEYDNRRRISVVYAGVFEFYPHLWRFERAKKALRRP